MNVYGGISLYMFWGGRKGGKRGKKTRQNWKPMVKS